MNYRIDLIQRYLSALLLILAVSLLLEGCSLVGAAGGLAIDSGNRKRADRIRSESQKIALRYGEGKTVHGVYRGLEYTPVTTPSGVPGTEPQRDPPIRFPGIGEPVALILRNDTTARWGTFAGITQYGEGYRFVLEPGPGQPLQRVPFGEIVRITTENGRILSAFPEPGLIELVYEINGESRSVPLREVSHINYRPTNHVFVLGGIGLAIDAVLMISVSQSLSGMTLD